jgi:hypothetical protein
MEQGADLKGVVFGKAAEYLATANQLFKIDEILFQLAFCLATEAVSATESRPGSFYCAVLDHQSRAPCHYNLYYFYNILNISVAFSFAWKPV